MSRRPRWRLLDTGARPAAWNMACDATLLARLGAGTSPPTVRFYEWDPPAVSIGHHQPSPEPAAIAALAARGADWARRPTGGRAVWHGPPGAELTYAIVAPLGRPPLPAGPREAYSEIHQALAEGLSRLGIDVRLAPVRRRAGPVGPRGRRACFAASVAGEI
ncbi:MAG TPA: octanoyltransferase, partial [Gemmatimonadota bacterium]|nr:octanoyltransferase [Gemmatimonadota bacterium]